MTASNEQPIILKKVKKVVHGHHGGAWKIAYADFVTAMMAFFLLMWLISMTTPEQKQGLADYFAPANVSRSTSGAGGINWRILSAALRKLWSSRADFSFMSLSVSAALAASSRSTSGLRGCAGVEIVMTTCGFVPGMRDPS